MLGFHFGPLAHLLPTHIHPVLEPFCLGMGVESPPIGEAHSETGSLDSCTLNSHYISP